MKKTLEQHLRDNAAEFGTVGSEYIVRVLDDDGTALRIYIRPSGRDGETKDYVVTVDKLTPYPLANTLHEVPLATRAKMTEDIINATQDK